MKCIIVDDDEGFCRIFSSILSRLNVDNVDSFHDFDTGIKAILCQSQKQEYADLIFVDYDLREEKDGAQFIEEASNVNDLSAYILITRDTEPQTIEKAQALGALHLSKEGDLDNTIIEVCFHAISKLTKQRTNALAKVNSQRDRIIGLNAELSHEVSSIINAISSLFDLLERKSKALGFFEKIVTICRKVREDIDKAMLMCKKLRQTGISNKGILNKAAVDLSVMASELREFSWQGVELFAELETERTEYFFDRAAINIVLGNLIRNVQDYCPDGTTLKICFSEVELLGSLFLRVDIVDNGLGIDVEYQNQILEPGERAGKGINYFDGGGLGFGLYLCKDLVEAHSIDHVPASFKLVSSGRTGTHFQFDLPQVIR